jgi:hypothetical protein
MTSRYSNPDPSGNYRTNTLCGAKIIIFSLSEIIKVKIKATISVSFDSRGFAVPPPGGEKWY